MRTIRELIDYPTLIYDERRMGVEECYGPLLDGTCPRAESGKPVACAGKWLRARGWNFRVAAGARYCPLNTLGIRRSQLASRRRATKNKAPRADSEAVAELGKGG